VILGVCGADGLIFGGVSSGDVMGSGLGGGVIEFSKLMGLVVVEFSPNPLAHCWLGLSSTLFSLSEKDLMASSSVFWRVSSRSFHESAIGKPGSDTKMLRE
jgi:hypothetical protein